MDEKEKNIKENKEITKKEAKKNTKEETKKETKEKTKEETKKEQIQEPPIIEINPHNFTDEIKETEEPKEPAEPQGIKPKKKRGRPKKTPELEINYANTIPMLINGLIFILSRTDYFINKPLDKDESELLKNSFAKAFPDADINPKFVFAFTIIAVLIVRFNYNKK